MFKCLEPITVHCACGSNSETQYCRGRLDFEIELIECTEQCRIVRRNARFREALNISSKSKRKKGGNAESEKTRIPFAATVLRRILKWMKMDKGHPTFIKENQKVLSPKFVYYLEGILDSFVSDNTEDAKVFRSKFKDIHVFLNPKTGKWNGVICLKPMNSEQRYITYCLVTAYHIKAEKIEHKHAPSFIELTKTKHSMIPDYLLSAALIDFQLHSDEMETLESMPPSSIIVVDDALNLSSSTVQDRLMAWAGDYRMYRNEAEQMFIVFTDENARNSAMTEMKKMGGRKAVAADSFTASAAQKKGQDKKRKKRKELSKAQQKSASKAKSDGWALMGNVKDTAEMPKKSVENLHLKLGNRF